MIREFFEIEAPSILLYGCTTWTNETIGEKAWWELHKNVKCFFFQILEATPYKTAVVQPLTSYLIN